VTEDDWCFMIIFNRWNLRPRCTTESADVGRRNEALVLKELVGFISRARCGHEVVALAEVGLLVRVDKRWLGTSPDAAVILLPSNPSDAELARHGVDREACDESIHDSSQWETQDLPL